MDYLEKIATHVIDQSFPDFKSWKHINWGIFWENVIAYAIILFIRRIISERTITIIGIIVALNYAIPCIKYLFFEK